MTDPTPPALPATKLDEIRAALFAALQETMAACGWAGRADQFPPRQIAAPWGWVDAATLASATQPGVPAGSVVATIPVCVALDGASREQVEAVDRLLAHGFQHLDRVERVRVTTAGPQFIELPSGQETRAVVFQVRGTLQARTLCSGSITDSNQAPPAP